MAEQSDDRHLFREAADLAIRLQSDPSNRVSVQMVHAWTSRSPAHAAAWARVAEIHGMTGKILAAERKTEGAGQLSRRTFMIGGAIGLGAVGAGSIVLPPMLTRMKADHVTSTAEIRRIDLPDASVMTLGPDSAVALAFSDAHRQIELLAGMAYFDVADDRTRPFVVSSGPVTATTAGTAFDISSDAGFVSISVENGVVDARLPGRSLNRDERLSAGDWITVGSSDMLERGTRETSQIASWRAGTIVAERETVAAMVSKISRWVPGRVVIADPSLGSRVVSGVFDLNDPLRALEGVARPFGAKVRGLGSLITVISPV
jgi:transmembrane sensor